MDHEIEPHLHPVELQQLRPTQMTVGMREVHAKRDRWRARIDKDGPDFLGRHMIPVVLGPRGHHWIIDNHHLARALLDEGVTHVLVSIVADLRMLEKRAFFTFMDNRNWLHPYDEEGHRRDHSDIPKKLSKLTDDPYRSLAGATRKAGGYAKTPTPYSEFLWADFFRRRIKTDLLSEDFEKALQSALQLAHSHDARFLPGFCGIEREQKES